MHLTTRFYSRLCHEFVRLYLGSFRDSVTNYSFVVSLARKVEKINHKTIAKNIVTGYQLKGFFKYEY